MFKRALGILGLVSNALRKYVSALSRSPAFFAQTPALE